MNTVITAEEAKELIKADRVVRAESCGKELDEILKKYNCTMDITTIIRGGRIIQKLDIIAN